MPELVRSQALNASTDISAKTVENPIMDRRTVQTGPSEIYGLQPKYLRHNLWEEDSTLSPTIAEWSERAKPLPHPPLSEILDSVSSKTIANFLDLFQVHTPIKIDVFENLLIPILYSSNLYVTVYVKVFGRGPTPLHKDSLEHMTKHAPCLTTIRRFLLNAHLCFSKTSFRGFASSHRS